MKDKRMILLYQAAPGQVQWKRKIAARKKKKVVVVMKEIPRITSIN